MIRCICSLFAVTSALSAALFAYAPSVMIHAPHWQTVAASMYGAACIAFVMLLGFTSLALNPNR